MKMTSLPTQKATCLSPLLELEYEASIGAAIDKVSRLKTDFEHYCTIFSFTRTNSQ